MKALASLSISGSLGFLVGLVLVSIIKPTEQGGVALLMALPTVVFSLIGGLMGWLLKRNQHQAQNRNNDPQNTQTGEGATC